jgi:hypothetical protein
MVLNRIDVFCSAKGCGQYLYTAEPPIKENPMCDKCKISTLKAALEKIRDEHGKVCNEYEVCTHISCASSHAAWTIAEQALKD